MRFVYVHGPSWLGSWEGQSEADICSGLTHVDARHWTLSPDGPRACESLLDRKIHATLIGVGVVSGVALAWTAVQTIVTVGLTGALRACCGRRGSATRHHGGVGPAVKEL